MGAQPQSRLARAGKLLRHLLAGVGDATSPPANVQFRADERLWLGTLLVIAFALRFGTAALFPSTYHPDELFQYWEQGYRLAEGTGVVPWEYREGIRSYILPGLIAAVLWSVRQVGGDIETARLVAQALLAASSLALVSTAYLWARRAAGFEAAILAGLVACTWFELVYFGAKPLTEVVAASALFPATYLLCVAPQAGRRRLVLGGVLLGLALVLRFHLAPAIGLVAIAACIRQGWRRALPAALAAMAILLVSGLIDWLTLGSPFQSIWLNLALNIGDDRASSYGTSPFFWYLFYYANAWTGFVAPIMLFLALGFRRAPLLFMVPVVVVVSHSFIAHKEYRFLFPALPFLLTLAAIGSHEACRILSQDMAPRWQRSAFLLLCFGWVLTSASLAFNDGTRTRLTQHSEILHAFRSAGQVETICGLGYAGLRWVFSGGHFWLGRNVPIYPLEPGETAAKSSAFNVLIHVPSQSTPAPPEFAERACFSGVCVAVRPGTCSPRPDDAINPFLERHGV